MGDIRRRSVLARAVMDGVRLKREYFAGTTATPTRRASAPTSPFQGEGVYTPSDDSAEVPASAAARFFSTSFTAKMESS